jgi:hypothetical protein
MGMKPRPPKDPGEAPKRSYNTKVIWQGKQNAGDGNDTRLIAVDADSQDGLPCQVLVEYARVDGTGQKIWLERSSFSGMSWLEKKLALEIAVVKKTLPVWATQKGEDARDAKQEAWEKRSKAYNCYLIELRDERDAEAAKSAELSAATKGLTTLPTTVLP